MYATETSKVIVDWLSRQSMDMTRMNILLLKKAGKFHYTCAKDRNRGLYDQSKHCKEQTTAIPVSMAVKMEMPENKKNKFTFKKQQNR